MQLQGVHADRTVDGSDLEEERNFVGEASMADIHWVRVLILCLFQWGNAESSIIDDRRSDEEVRAIAASYVGNIDSFSRYRCEYVLNQYRPKSLQKIKNGDCLPEAMATAHYQRDGDKTDSKSKWVMMQWRKLPGSTGVCLIRCVALFRAIVGSTIQ